MAVVSGSRPTSRANERVSSNRLEIKLRHDFDLRRACSRNPALCRLRGRELRATPCCQMSPERSHVIPAFHIAAAKRVEESLVATKSDYREFSCAADPL